MQLSPLILATGLLVLAAQPAQAASCVLLPVIVGAFGDATDNYTQMSSEGGGRSATFTALVVGSSTVTVGLPTVVYTGAHPHSGDAPLIKYRAVGLLGNVHQQPYTNQATSFGINTLDGTVLATVDAKITNPLGFAQGDYQLRTVVTCS